MEESDQKKHLNKKIAEIKTFPVTLTLGEIKENITINTNTTSQVA